MIRVYFNLHKKVWSVQTKNYKGNWIVTDHRDSLLVNLPTFKVSQAGRDRVLRERKKNVHAFVLGQRGDIVTDLPEYIQWEQIRYNPYETNQFVYSGDGEVVGSDRASAYMAGGKVWVNAR